MLVKKIWDAWMIIILSYISVYYPYKIAFLHKQPFEVNFLFILDALIDCSFIIDLIINFFTVYLRNKEGILEDNLKLIANNYLTGWFSVDLLSV